MGDKLAAALHGDGPVGEACADGRHLECTAPTSCACPHHTSPTRTLRDRISAALFVHPISDRNARKSEKKARRLADDAAIAVLDAIAEHEEARS